MARKVVGVGSVGTRCWIVLLLGRDASDPLFLQVKEAERSVLKDFAGASEYANHGQRVVAGQRLMQAASDIFLGWQRSQVDPTASRMISTSASYGTEKFSADIEAMTAAGMRAYGELCGGRWPGHMPDPGRIAIAAYLGQAAIFDRAIAEFASAYADQNERDNRPSRSRRLRARDRVDRRLRRKFPDGRAVDAESRGPSPATMIDDYATYSQRLLGRRGPAR